jgi:hypothetical protein
LKREAGNIPKRKEVIRMKKAKVCYEAIQILRKEHPGITVDVMARKLRCSRGEFFETLRVHHAKKWSLLGKRR